MSFTISEIKEGSVIAVKVKSTEDPAEKDAWCTFEIRGIYEGKFRAEIIVNSYGAFDNETMYERWINDRFDGVLLEF